MCKHKKYKILLRSSKKMQKKGKDDNFLGAESLITDTMAVKLKGSYNVNTLMAASSNCQNSNCIEHYVSHAQHKIITIHVIRALSFSTNCNSI